MAEAHHVHEKLFGLPLDLGLELDLPRVIWRQLDPFENSDVTVNKALHPFEFQSSLITRNVVNRDVCRHLDLHSNRQVDTRKEALQGVSYGMENTDDRS